MSDVHNPQSSLPPGSVQLLVDHFPNGVLALVDTDLRFQAVGPSSRRLCGWSVDNVIGKRLEEVFPAETAERLESNLAATLDGEGRSFDAVFLGETHHVETRPVDVNGKSHAVVATQVVTDDRHATTGAEQQAQHLEQFASMLSHDLRNHLNVAHGRLDLFHETGDEAHLDDVETALERIEELTTDLTVLGHRDQADVDHDPVSLADVARDAWETTDTRSATLSTDASEFVGDYSQLQALFENLFRNAVGHGGSDVAIRVGPLADGFYVEDTGTGIPPEDREQVFDHGFTTSYSGDGVGLAIVERIAEAHDLTVSLSESPEGGCRFEFRAGDSQ
ncbi:PAS domain S-box-containing protein [Halogranum gelatinilyticum]|uniref:histidine kinase n=1 Tax=Halogranum gelatinilyticum TaxID=660521 RepID=A0A1G9XBW4_9EURY|nr:PAS domain-containing sensor histidine kinase [Halogranum gelatinilyticum]SDM94250.1 PAS domain S-box-containing protein [Halogranum gelatinilyticum]